MKTLFKILFLIVINAGIFWILDKIFENTFIISGGIKGYIIVAIVFGLVDTIIKPIINLITLPIRIITFGLFKFVINGLLLWILQQSIDILAITGVSLQINGITTYFIIGFILAIIDSVFDNF